MSVTDIYSQPDGRWSTDHIRRTFEVISCKDSKGWSDDREKEKAAGYDMG